MAEASKQNTSATKLRRRGVGKKCAFALVATLVFFGACEGVLRFIVPADIPLAEDPYVGFSGHARLLERGYSDSGEAILRTRFSKQVWFNHQEFPEEKPSNTFRIVCLGGSTTYGRPFDDSTSYCRWLREMLPIVDPTQRWEVINAGGISYASYRIVNVMEEFAQRDVDLFILYTGQNEFLEWRTYERVLAIDPWYRDLTSLLLQTRTGGMAKRLTGMISARSDEETRADRSLLPAEVDELLNHSVGPANYRRDDAWATGVVDHFKVNLERMRLIARRCGARLAVVSPVSNLKDCRPFKSQFDQSISDDQQARAREAIERAKSDLDASKWEDAIARLTEAVSASPRMAEAHYWLGKAFLANGQTDEAGRCFQRAIDEDICPLRAITPLRAAIGQLRTQQDVIFIDFEARLKQICHARFGHPYPGNEFFLDHVHPTIEMHRELAVEMMRVLSREDVIVRAPDETEIIRVTQIVESGLDRESQGIAFRNLAKVMHWAGRFDEARRNARNALRLIPGDGESQFLLADSLSSEGQIDEAIEIYSELFADGTFDRALLPFGQLLAQKGDHDAAKAYLMQAVFATEGETQARAYFVLGQLHEKLGERDLAIECFEYSDRIFPEHPPTQEILARLRREVGAGG